VRLAIAVPCHVFVAPQMAQSLARMCAFHVLDSQNNEHGWEMSGPRFFGNAVSTFGRNELVRWARSEDATHVLWIDTDSVFPADAIRRMMTNAFMNGIGPEFIGANFALKDGSGRSSAWGLDGERLKPKAEGVEEVSTLGFGFTLTSMAVLDAVGDPWFKTVDGERGGPADEYRFCQLARAAGFPPYVDHALSRECAHVGLHPFRLPEG